MMRIKCLKRENAKFIIDFAKIADFNCVIVFSLKLDFEIVIL